MTKKKAKVVPIDKKKLSNNPPTYLKVKARYMWRRLVPLIKKDPNVNDLDRTLVETFCINYQMLRDAYDDINKSGQTRAVYKTVLSSTTGEKMGIDFVGFKQNPSTRIIDSASQKLQQVGRELGLTPKSRAELMSLDGHDGDVDVGKQMKDLLG